MDFAKITKKEWDPRIGNQAHMVQIFERTIRGSPSGLPRQSSTRWPLGAPRQSRGTAAGRRLGFFGQLRESLGHGGDRRLSGGLLPLARLALLGLATL